MELVVKPVGLTKQSKEVVNSLRGLVLNVAEQLIYVIDEQVKIFKNLKNAILDAHEANERQNIQFNYDENLKYLETEYPEAIRRIYRSFNKYCFEIKKLAKKPFPKNKKDPFFEPCPPQSSHLIWEKI